MQNLEIFQDYQDLQLIHLLKVFLIWHSCANSHFNAQGIIIERCHGMKSNCSYLTELSDTVTAHYTFIYEEVMSARTICYMPVHLQST